MRGVPNVSDPDSQLFAALADQERRLLLERLAAGPAPVYALVSATRISRSAVSQHLGVLRRAGLVRSERRGREIVYSRVDEGLISAREWLAHFRHTQLGRLAPTGEVPLHVSAIAVPVVDQDRARAFYIETLGFEIVTDRTVNHWRWISLLPPGGSCAIGLVSAPSAGIWTGVSLLTSQLDELYRRWAQRGVTFDGPPTMQAWNARTAIFADIDRNRYQLVEVPSSL
jgi:DNA-binding transcriptional ArsR family regulator/catechol 2,3-dioxygenase-like lactoylglutathione lyase family enzyme